MSERMRHNDYFRKEIIDTDDNFTIFSPLEYFTYCQQYIPQAKSRVWLKAMAFESGHVMDLLTRTLEKSAERGIDTRFTADYFHKMVTDGELDYVPNWTHEKRQFRSFKRMAKRDRVASMEEKGVNVMITNPPRNPIELAIPGTGRDHIKIGVIDDVAFIGGLNLTDKDFSRTDYMVKVTEPWLVDAIARVYKQPRPQDDYEVRQGNTSLLVDSGQRGKSIILDRAVTLVNTAQRSVAVTSQYTPDGALPQALYAANKRDVAVQAIVSEPGTLVGKASWLFDRINEAELQARGWFFPVDEYPDWLHAKAALIDEELPTASVIVGSHNFSGKGVAWGNQEIAIQSSDERLVCNVKQLFARLRPHTTIRR